MTGIIKESISRNLRHPKGGPVGWLVNKFIFEKINIGLEKKAVEHCKIQKDDKVLEVGFGPGFGLSAAYSKVKDGKGQVYGIDISQVMVNKARKTLSTEIKLGKVHIYLGNVACLPFDAHTFDHVFHCNCYYFWDDQVACAKELLRVLKPNAAMITILNQASLDKVNSAGLMRHGNTDCDTYMKSLETSGFQNIDLTSHKAQSGSSYQVIYAQKP